MEYEERLLKYLVDNYRKSLKDLGNNKTNKRTQIKPEKLYKKYNDNDGDFEEVAKLNRTVESLTEMGFITNEKENFGTQILRIYLVDARIQDIEQYLADKYGYISKDMQITKLKNIINKYNDASSICKKECDVLAEYVKCRKIPKNINDTENILKAIDFIENNQQELYIREVSMRVYGDSKFFEDNTLDSVCSILRKYSDKTPENNELSDEVLSDYHIFKSSQKIRIKGNVIINILGKEIDVSVFSGGIEFRTSDLVNIQSVKLMSSEFMTIENLTSYLRYHKDNVVTFYLGGYANRYQRDFIKLVYSDNPNVRYSHFGDIDAGGFWIHNNLCEITGIDFELFCMSIDEFKNNSYASCLHELSINDRIRLKELEKIDKYSDVVQYMLDNNVKLEQEIVSLELMKII